MNIYVTLSHIHYTRFILTIGFTVPDACNGCVMFSHTFLVCHCLVFWFFGFLVFWFFGFLVFWFSSNLHVRCRF